MNIVYYKTTWKKILLVSLTVVLLLTSLVTSNPLVLVYVSFASLLTLMFHFTLFEDTSDSNKINSVDFYLQIVLIVFSLLKFLLNS